LPARNKPGTVLHDPAKPWLSSFVIGRPCRAAYNEGRPLRRGTIRFRWSRR
jgi:hypothetical protein